MVAENPSASLNKISEVYDRIAFAGVGKYNEFDRLREAGIRWADGTGFTYSREDVDARALANYYAQHVGDMFTEGQKPLEVEILVAQLGNLVPPDQAVPRRLRGDHLRRTTLRGARRRRRDDQDALRRVRGHASSRSNTTLKNAVSALAGSGPHDRGRRSRGGGPRGPGRPPYVPSPERRAKSSELLR